MTPLECTLLSDGSSDRALIPIIEWLLRQHETYSPRGIEHYNPGRFKHPPRSLHERIDHAVDNFPCDLLFIHRDAERGGLEQRAAEIRRELAQSVFGRVERTPAVLVIPGRMTEARLLFDEACIRAAAGCPRGNVPLNLPTLRDCEKLPDPKSALHRCLRLATQKEGRHLKRFNVDSAIHLVAESSRDFSPLRRLGAFQRLEEDLISVLRERNWN